MKKTIRIPHILIESKHSLTLNQYRLMMIILSEALNDGDFLKEYRIDPKDFVELFGINGGGTRFSLPIIAKEILEKTLEVEEDNNPVYINWISSYKLKNGIIFIVLNPKIKSYLTPFKIS